MSELDKAFRAQLRELDDLDGTAQDDQSIRTAKNACAVALGLLHEYVPLLGYIVRSTNMRNAFGIYAPLQRLCEIVLEPTVSPLARSTRLILSSEWTYQPQLYPEKAYLPGYVLIGLPAPESSNPLLLPLAGHELGHSLWRAIGMGDDENETGKAFYTSIITSVITTVILNKETFIQTYGLDEESNAIDVKFLVNNLKLFNNAVEWTRAQAEETFCDFIGMRIFGASYFKAFTYMASPRISMQRIEEYPRLTTRAQNMVDAAPYFGIKPPPGFTSDFEDDPEADHLDSVKFNLFIADESLKSMIEQVRELALKSCDQDQLPILEEGEAEQILNRFRYVVPAKGASSLAAILEAAWLAYEDETLWKNIPEVCNKRDRALKELVLKNIEIFEIEQRKKVDQQ